MRTPPATDGTTPITIDIDGVAVTRNLFDDLAAISEHHNGFTARVKLAS